MRALPITSLLSLLALSSTAAWAQQDDPLMIRAGYTLQTDSNLFRLPSGANTTALLGKSSGAEQIGITTVGLGFATTQSLQRFELDASLVDYRYQNFDYLSFTATNFDAAWRWSLTPRLTGNLTGSHKETLNSFADYQGFNQRNKRTDTNSRFDALYELSGPWRLLAGVTQAEQRNEQALVAGGDYRSTGADLGLRQVYGSGSSISLVGTLANGGYLNRSTPNAGAFDDSFKQLSTSLQLHWVFSGSTTLDGSVTQINRTHPTYAQRDYSGLNTEARLGWAITGKTRLNASYARTLDAYATANSNYSQTDRLQAGVTWAISQKIQLALNQSWAQIDYLGTPATATSTRRDTTHDSSIALGWEPLQRLNLSAAVQSVNRGSSQPGLDYDSTLLNLQAQYSF
jgi:exopolysaccharide biosynthesis operon protein EpsL